METKQLDTEPTRNSNHILLMVCGLAIIATIFLLTYKKHPQYFALHFNAYALLSGSTILVNGWLVMLMLRLSQKSEEANWFVFYILAVSVAAIGECLQRLSINPTTAIFWSDISGAGIALLPVAFYLFVASYIKPLRAQTLLLLPSLLLGSSVITLFSGMTSIFFQQDATQTTLHPWGYIANSGPGFLLILIWVELFMLAALFELIRFYFYTTNDLLKRQTRIYIIAILIPMVFGTLSDGILPLFHNYSIPPMSVMLTTVTSIVAYYGLRRYHLFQINPALLAEKVLATMHEAVIVTKANFQVDIVNSEAEHLFAMNRKELTKQYLFDLVTRETWDDVAKYLEDTSFREDYNAIDKHWVQSSDGQKMPVRISSSKLTENGKFVAYIFVIADITAITRSYHRLEESNIEIQRQNAALELLQKQLAEEKANVEHTVEVRTKELRDAQEELKAADTLKTEFIVLSSHNLRTPLTIMKSVLAMLSGSQNFNEEQIEHVRMLLDSTNRLSELIEDILTIATLEAGEQLRLEPVSITQLLEPLLMEAKNSAAAAHLEVSVAVNDQNAVINANIPRLRSAIRNVLNNAVKFTQKGGISIRTEREGSDVVLSIKDTGIGISQEEVEKLFTMFHRATPYLEYNYEGRGIGLYITKLILQEHHGSIAATSELGKGTEFVIRIPLVNTATSAEQSPTVSQPASA